MRNDSAIGYVYVLSNPGHRGLLKVGFTTKDVEKRVKELQTAGTPYDFKIVARFRVAEPRLVEQKAHKLLARQRANKEWFRVSLVEAQAAIQKAAEGRLIGVLTQDDYQTAKGAVSRWGRFVKSEKVTLDKLIAQLEKEKMAKRSAAIDAAQVAKAKLHDAPSILRGIASYLVLPLGLIGVAVGLFGGLWVLLVTGGGALVLLMPWLHAQDSKQIKASQAYQAIEAKLADDLATVEGLVQPAVEAQAARTRKRIALAESEYVLSEQTLKNLMAVSLPEGLPQCKEIACNACGQTFKAYAAKYHVCPSCDRLLKGLPSL